MADSKAGKLGPFKLLPVAPGTCEQCATKHPAEDPHNQQSLHYQYWFYGKHGRWPTWEDAMEHCTHEIKQLWRGALQAKGIATGAVNTSDKPVEPPPEPLPRVLLVTRGTWQRAYPMVWTPDVYHQGNSMHAAWAYPGVISPDGCKDPVFFRDWLSSCLYEGDGTGGKLKDGNKLITVKVLNGSIFEEK